MNGEEKVVGFKNGLRNTMFTFITYTSNEKILVMLGYGHCRCIFVKCRCIFRFNARAYMSNDELAGTLHFSCIVYSEGL